MTEARALEIAIAVLDANPVLLVRWSELGPRIVSGSAGWLR